MRQPGTTHYAGLLACALLCGGTGSTAEEIGWDLPTLNTLGVPGLLDMPSAHTMEDADASVTVSAFRNTQRNTFHFQITPRVSGVFRYSYIDNFVGRGAFYDRSFDLRYVLAEETRTRPAVTLGLQDFGGTGVYGGEYVVATKTVGRWRATGGLGWGRFGSRKGFDNPLGVIDSRFDTRPGQDPGGDTGQLDVDHWFRGDAAFFGGVQYLASERLVLTAEYSSDAYEDEAQNTGFQAQTPLNFGATYRYDTGVDLRAAYLYGETLALQLSYTLNPKDRTRTTGGIEPAPLPVTPRPKARLDDLGWTEEPNARSILEDNTAKVFEGAGLRLERMSVSARSARVFVRNLTYSSPAQAVGRAARLLSFVLPASVETFHIVTVTDTGLPAAEVTLQRRDMETLEYAPDNAWTAYARAQIEDAAATALPQPPPRDGTFNWGFGTYIDYSLFDPSAPVRADYGLSLSAGYEPLPGLTFSGIVKQRVGGNLDGARPSDSAIQRVRTDGNLYAAATDLSLAQLVGSYAFRPAPAVYSRLSLGYFEQMYAGVSGEVLWKPIDSAVAFGVEVNHVWQRDFDQDFDLRDYNVTTGHASAYLQMANGFHLQVDGGRYLAGDWGGTVALDREFKNGVKIGAFATLTDVSFDDFGEGSFDKGLRFTVPVSLITGKPSRQNISRVIRPTLRDGGARVDVPGRLYEDVRDYDTPALAAAWGRFWR